ncbi:MAG: DUF885 family protein [Planctomycetota bacterium JB042]
MITSLLAPALALALVQAAAPTLPALIDRYVTDRRALERFHDLPWSSRRLDRLDAFGAEWAARLDALPWDGLDRESRIDWILLRNLVDRDAAERADVREKAADDAPFLPFAGTILDLEHGRWTLEEVDGETAAETLDRLAERIDAARQATEGDEAERPTPEQAKRLAGKVDGLKRWLDRWHAHGASFDPVFGWWTETPHRAAAEALDAYARHLRETVAGLKGKDDDPIVGQPLGVEALTRALRHELLAESPAELIAVGEREFAWCDEELRKAADAAGLDGDVAAAIERVKDDHVAPGEQDELVLSLAREAIAFLDDRDLVTIPPLCRETWRVDMMSPREQRMLPFAYYGGQKMVAAFPTDSMPHETKRQAMRGNNVAFTRCVTPHELIPGHHLQGFVGERERTHRRPFRTPFLGEGWCLYWEFRFLDLGWARTPEERVGMLVWRRHRAARVLLSLKYHLGEISTAEMIDFLVERAGLERDGATGEVRRWIDGGYGPLYQCAYLIGGKQMEALRREVGDRMSERAFHDAVLARNSIPIAMIRAGLLEEVELTRPFTPTWRIGG